MKTRTKLLALVLTLAMLVSVFAAFPVNAAMSTAVFQVDADNVKDGGTPGTYNIANAVTNVKDGGTIKMVGNAESTDRDDLTGAGKSYKIDGSKGDGTCYTWTNASSSTRSLVKLGGSGKTVEFTNINFHAATRRQVLEIGDGQNVTVKLGQGVTFTAEEGNTWSNAVIMFAYSNTLIVDGADFQIPGVAAITCWNGGAHTIILNDAKLSSNASGKAIIGNSTSNPFTIRVDGMMEDVLVYDSTGANPTTLTVSHINRTNIKYGTGANSDYAWDSTFVSDGDNGVKWWSSDIATAVSLVKNDGTIKLLKNAETTGRVDISSANKSFKIDGKKDANTNYTWTRTSSGTDSIAKFGGAGKTITFTNINFHSANKRQILETNGTGVTLDLGSGVKFTAESGTYTNGVIMLAKTDTVILNGAEFNIPAPAVASWGASASANVVLNSGVLSYGKNAGNVTAAMYYGYDASMKTNVTFNSASVKVNDYVTGETGVNARPLVITDILKPGTLTYNDVEASDFYPIDTNAYITINGGSEKYYNLVDAVEAANSNDTLTVTGQMVVFSAAVVLNKSLTLQGADATASITANGTYTDFAVMVLHNSTVTVENLKLIGTSKNTADINNGGFGGGVVTLGDTTSGQVAYTGSHLILNDGAVIDFTVCSNGGNTGGNGVSALVEGDSKLTVNTGATITTGGTALRADGYSMKVTIAGGTVTSANRGMVIAGGSTNTTLTVTDGTLATTSTSAWLIKAYATFSANLNGGTLSTKGGKVFETNIGDRINDCVTLGNVTIKVNDATVYNATYNATFTDKDMMYLYIDEEKTTTGSGLGFASQVNVNTNADVTYGVLFIPSSALGEDELVYGTWEYSGYEVLAVSVEQPNSNGFVKAAVTGLTKNMMDTAIVGRAYATVTITIGDLTLTRTVYGEQMSATARDFARAYVRDNQNIDADTQAVVDYFLENGNV